MLIMQEIALLGTRKDTLMPSNTIVCHQDIIQIIKHFPDVTSDMLAAKMPMGTRLQDILLEMVKDSVCKCDKPDTGKFTMSPEGHIIGQQIEVTLDDGVFVLEWDGNFWVKRYKIIESNVTKYVGEGFFGGEFKTTKERQKIDVNWEDKC